MKGPTNVADAGTAVPDRSQTVADGRGLGVQPPLPRDDAELGHGMRAAARRRQASTAGWGCR